jgi:hydroxypyruvate reductase
MNPRLLLLELFDAALRVVDGRGSVYRELRTFGHGPDVVFAVGKAASAMARGALDALGDHVKQVLVITKDGHADPELRRDRRVTVLESAHPVPDERSLLAGAELERRIGALTPGDCPIFLVSGGSSSLVESLHEGVTLGELRALNERGLASGWGIAQLNAERARLSRLKGGGVARLLGRRDAHALFISDVPHDDPGVIGSGLLGVHPDGGDLVTRRVVANVEMAARAVRDAARAHGLDLRTRVARFCGDAQGVAGDFVAQLRDCEGDGLVWGGESTVTLPERPGRGGRNQHLALAAARALRANDALTILAAGTDGTDGPTEDAGAIIDAGTVDRAELAGVDVERALRDFDSGTALEAAADLVHTGPTGTNVGDILIGIKHAGRRFRDLAPPRML